ncbi:transporter, small conductance mechanosensitive ion channel MscS family protein [Gemella bergeri ATCC 700627]|uniref:Transporter, small conductance mechanosensitive ion channel MscS family protein n=1 Tax=Gemella bergeri ATCC 700627 TaxID=1321820 RepID=U2QIJ1_9BACL|nr:mechanosensitive ion channel domain-containing protein [Gemella bergeri]ERK56014.1 transporter, small conductance mechanosensitive ion channel MscS family protein [Gemella bergeri ATCC 700627]
MVKLIEKVQQTFNNTDFVFVIFEKIIVIMLIIVLASIGVKFCNKVIDYIMTTKENANKRFNIKINEKRSETLHKLVKSCARYIIYFIAFFQMLSALGINTTSIVASAGIASVAIGFGAQSLVKDIISGFFIILEGQFDVGDNVKIYNQGAFIAGGYVMALGLRSTKIRSNNGEIYFIPNGTINQVINYSLTYNLAVLQFSIQITSTMEETENRVEKLLNKVNSDDSYHKLIYKNDKLHIDCIEKIADNIVTISIVGKAKIGKKQEIETMLRRDFYNEFGIALTTRGKVEE